MEFPTRYDPSREAEQYRRWEEAGCFMPSDTSRTGEYFSIVLPPPNVTATLHAGSAVMLALEDMMVRYHRMKGDRTVWIPGVDHAAIATQNVVEKKLKKENVLGRRTRHELGREAFVREVEQFVAQTSSRILVQMRALGASLDWSRYAYTLDAPRSLAVRTIFKQLYDAGILYRGNRVVNWCPRCKSTLADDEVEHQEAQTTLYTFRYDEQWPEDLAIATTRPETKLGDTAVAVHTDDPRAAMYGGREIVAQFVPGVTLRIRVVADPTVDRAFGTGALGVTPAHAAGDADMAERHGLSSRQVITEDGVMAADLGAYAGLSVREAREKIIADLRSRGLITTEQPITHNLSVCYRCETPVEPLPKLQWFVAVSKPFRRRGGAPSPPAHGDRGANTVGGHGGPPLQSLKDLALDAVRSGAITILPERFVKEYFHWMEHLRDWCISRQIWFGHRIPAWYRGDETYVGVEPPQGEGWQQDPDTLDTWFSSGTWTFSTLGWPGQTSDRTAFHPTSVLETGRDIIFFWVARMILMTEFALGEIPFRTVYLHGLVRDMKGRKMSKSLGNGIDPLVMTEKYGADAVRLALFIGTSPGQDTKLDEQKIAGYAKFVTKLWNIARYVMQVGAGGQGSGVGRASGLTIPDHWMLAKRDQLIRDVTVAYEAHEYSKAAQMAYDFAWHDFADWYIESVKGISAPHQPALLRETLERILQLLHPAMPFVTEALWQRMGHTDMLMTAPWPTARSGGQASDEQCQMFTFLQECTTAIRQIRNEQKIPPKELLTVTLVSGNDAERAWCAHGEVQALVQHFARVREVRIAERGDGTSMAVRSTTVYVSTEGAPSA